MSLSVYNLVYLSLNDDDDDDNYYVNDDNDDDPISCRSVQNLLCCENTENDDDNFYVNPIKTGLFWNHSGHR